MSQKPHVSVHVICGCGSVLLWWLCSMLCTSSFVAHVMFSCSRPNTNTGWSLWCNKLYTMMRQVALLNCAPGAKSPLTSCLVCSWCLLGAAGQWRFILMGCAFMVAVRTSWKSMAGSRQDVLTHWQLVGAVLWTQLLPRNSWYVCLPRIFWSEFLVIGTSVYSYNETFQRRQQLLLKRQ